MRERGQVKQHQNSHYQHHDMNDTSIMMKTVEQVEMPTLLQPTLEDATQQQGNYHITLKLNQSLGNAIKSAAAVRHSSSMRSQKSHLSNYTNSTSIPDGEFDEDYNNVDRYGAIMRIMVSTHSPMTVIATLLIAEANGMMSHITTITTPHLYVHLLLRWQRLL